MNKQVNTYNTVSLAQYLKYLKLEKELGCPLEDVFKALEDGITDKKGFDYDCARLCKSKKGYRFEIEKAEFCQIDSDEFPKEYDYFYLKDYRKTWWVKDEKEN